MKVIPAFARMEECIPEGERSPATMAIPIIHEKAEKSMSLRRPTRSMMRVPERAPMKEVTLSRGALSQRAKRGSESGRRHTC